jgi:predicted metal-dependent phosphoesterase TrpH
MPQDKWIDLHLHSTFSDGRHTPRELVEFAADRQLAAISITDHDCLDGYRDLPEATAGTGIEFISGIELSCVNHGRDLHVLGFGVDVNDAPFQDMLTRFRESRELRGVKIVQKLNAIGVNIDTETVFAKAGEGALGRPHIAEALVEGGYARDFSEAFNKYIGEDCPAYVEKFKMNPGEAIGHIHASGGLAFVAHAGYYMEDMDKFYELLDCGFDGIEIYHPNHSNAVVQRLSEIAEKRGLLVSGGSDFHGFAERDAVGEPRVPYELFEKIKNGLNAAKD